MTNSVPNDTTPSTTVNSGVPKTKFFSIPNTKSQDVSVLGGSPWEATIPARPGLKKDASKEDYSSWCGDIKTKWCFVNMCEGVNPGQRVTANNPMKYLHGLVADFDEKLSVAEAIVAVTKKGIPGLLPVAISQTFSGNLRMVWTFAEPLPLDDKDLVKEFLEVAFKQVHAKGLVFGFDKKSGQPTQYFEIGSDWVLVPGGVPIARDTVFQWFSDACDNAHKKNSRGTVDIPFERIAAEVEKQFPGKWPGKFEVGAVGPLFWVDDGSPNMRACMLKPDRVICYSDRALRGSESWESILGRKFVAEFEEERTGAASADFWYDGQRYWSKDGLWCRLIPDEMSRRLKVRYTLSGQVGSKDTASEVDKALVRIQESKRVQNVAPFIYNPEEIVNFNGLKYLNINNRKMLEPAPADATGDFPWLREFFEKCWDGVADENGIGQRDYFFAWLKRFWESGRVGRLLSGQVVFIAGLAGQGKTFLSSFIMGELGGGFSDASGYLLGGDNFNKELAEVAIWSVDDGMATLDGNSRRTFSAKIKKTIANPTISYHPKFLDASVMPWQGRLIVTCNTDPESLSIIPTTDISITDKLMLFKFGDWFPKFPPNPVIEAQVKKELPFFLRWLSQWEPPASIVAPKDSKSRYGIVSFHHPEILDHSRQLSSHNHLREELDTLRRDPAFIAAGLQFWEGTAGDLLRAGKDFFATKVNADKAGILLSTILKERTAPWLSRREGRSNSTLWKIMKAPVEAL